jgi:formylglycine-generating enzyme required for sulfatase activity
VIDEVTKCEPDERPSVAKIVQAFSLDRFEVSVGRFRAFLDAYNAWGGPGVGAGASAESSASWQAEWSDALAADRATFAANLQSSECKGADLTPYYTFDDGLSPKRPINCVTWYEAFAFCIWDGGRLPTEAEWELAASGGEERLFPWGSETPTPSRAAFAWTPSPDGPDFLPEVGSRTAGRGRFGHMDLAGSVWEWTSSLEASYSGVIAPSQRRSMRGGSWDGGPKFLRGTYRGFQDPAARFPTVGFRCAREAKP